MVETTEGIIRVTITLGCVTMGSDLTFCHQEWTSVKTRVDRGLGVGGWGIRVLCK